MFCQILGYHDRSQHNGSPSQENRRVAARSSPQRAGERLLHPRVVFALTSRPAAQQLLRVAAASPPHPLFCGCSCSRLLPWLFPVYSPWLLGLWPKLLWLSRALAWLAGLFVLVCSFSGCFAQEAGGGASNACGLFRVSNVTEGHLLKKTNIYTYILHI